MKTVIRQILDGDRAAFREIVQRYGPSVRAYLAGRLSEPTVVDDLSQETFIAVYEHLARFDVNRDLGNWIKGIAHKRLMMHLRRSYTGKNVLDKIRQEVMDLVDNDVESMYSVDEQARLVQLRACLEKLPEKSSAMIRDRYFENVSVIEIARSLSTTASAISSSLYRIRRQLRSCMRQGATG